MSSRREAQRRWREKNKEHIKQYEREYYLRTKEHQIKRALDYQARRPDIKKKADKKYRHTHKVKIKKQRNSWLEKNKHKVSGYQRRHYVKTINYQRERSRQRNKNRVYNKERDKVYATRSYKNNKVKRLAKVKEYAAKNTDSIKEYQKQYRIHNKERIAKRRKLNPKNADVARRGRLLRRARKRGASGVNTRAQIEARVELFGGKCAYCGAQYEHLDHAIALARKGSNWPANFRPACASCNRKKHSSNWRSWKVKF